VGEPWYRAAFNRMVFDASAKGPRPIS
jgi:hypothetical protein